MAQYVKPRFLYIHATGYRNINSNSLFLILLGHFVQGNISHLSSKKLWMRLNRGDESSSLDEIFHPRQYLTERSLSSSIVPFLKFRASFKEIGFHDSQRRGIGLAARKNGVERRELELKGGVWTASYYEHRRRSMKKTLISTFVN